MMTLYRIKDGIFYCCIFRTAGRRHYQLLQAELAGMGLRHRQAQLTGQAGMEHRAWVQAERPVQRPVQQQDLHGPLAMHGCR